MILCAPAASFPPAAGVPRGFTVVELLVVVAMIGVLAVLLLPSLAGARSEGQSTKCLSNLRQLAVGATAYSGDHDGLLIPMCVQNTDGTTTAWRILIAPYLDLAKLDGGGPFICPADPANAGARISGNGWAPSSYGINSYWISLLTTERLHDYLATIRNHRLSAVLHPSRMVFLGDLAFLTNPGAEVLQWKAKKASGNPGYARLPSDTAFYGGDSWDLFPRHGAARCNVVFYDGHSESVDFRSAILAHPPGDPSCIYANQ